MWVMSTAGHDNHQLPRIFTVISSVTSIITCVIAFVMARMLIESCRREVVFGFKLKDIQLRLKEEDIFVSKRSLCLLIKKYKLHWTILDMPRPVQPGKLSLEHLKIIDSALEQDDKTSAVELRLTQLRIFFLGTTKMTSSFANITSAYVCGSAGERRSSKSVKKLLYKPLFPYRLLTI